MIVNQKNSPNTSFYLDSVNPRGTVQLPDTLDIALIKELPTITLDIENDMAPNSLKRIIEHLFQKEFPVFLYSEMDIIVKIDSCMDSVAFLIKDENTFKRKVLVTLNMNEFIENLAYLIQDTPDPRFGNLSKESQKCGQLTFKALIKEYFEGTNSDQSFGSELEKLLEYLLSSSYDGKVNELFSHYDRAYIYHELIHLHYTMIYPNFIYLDDLPSSVEEVEREVSQYEDFVSNHPLRPKSFVGTREQVIMLATESNNFTFTCIKEFYKDDALRKKVENFIVYAGIQELIVRLMIAHKENRNSDNSNLYPTGFTIVQEIVTRYIGYVVFPNIEILVELMNIGALTPAICLKFIKEKLLPSISNNP